MKKTKDLKMSEGEVVERAMSLATEWMWAVSLQYDRIINPRPQDQAFHQFGVNDFNEADIHFFVIALRRLRQSATTIEQVPQQWDTIRRAIDEFDKRVPWLKHLRDVFEHLEDYAIDSNCRKSTTSCREIQVWSASKHSLIWLGYNVDYQEAHLAAKELYKAILSARNSFISQ
jgi:hypothetical protein